MGHKSCLYARYSGRWEIHSRTLMQSWRWYSLECRAFCGTRLWGGSQAPYSNSNHDAGGYWWNEKRLLWGYFTSWWLIPVVMKDVLKTEMIRHSRTAGRTGAGMDLWQNRPTCGRLQNLRKVSHGHLEQPYDEAVPRTFPLHATISVGGVSLLFIKTSGSWRKEGNFSTWVVGGVEGERLEPGEWASWWTWCPYRAGESWLAVLGVTLGRFHYGGDWKLMSRFQGPRSKVRPAEEAALHGMRPREHAFKKGDFALTIKI